MACRSTGNPAIGNKLSSAYSKTMVARRPKSNALPSRLLSIISCDRRESYNSLVFQAARLLSPPTRFEASKLKVVFTGEDIEKHPACTIPRAYILTHCDFTANLTLAVSNITYNDKQSRWQTTLQRDDVVAEWKKENEEISLHVHCYVSGANIFQELASEFRYHIFSKELPLVLKAVVHGDAPLFRENPELMDSAVMVYFHSKSRRYNRVECWGPLKDAIQRKFEDRSDSLRSRVARTPRTWASPRTIFQALFAFLL